MSKTDQQLITAFVENGDDGAFGELVVRYQDRIVNSFTKILKSHEEACDVAQEAFLQAYRKLHTFRSEAKFSTWLFRIAMNKSISRQRKQKRETVSLDAVRDLSGKDAVDSNPSASPSANLEREDRQQLVQKALNELSEEYRTIIVLQTIEGLSYEEISSILECPVGTVRSRLHRARLELRDRLERLGVN